MKSKSSYIYLLTLLAASLILQKIWDYSMEFIIVIAFMYDIGFELRFVDELIQLNNRFNTWLHKKVDVKHKKKK